MSENVLLIGLIVLVAVVTSVVCVLQVQKRSFVMHSLQQVEWENEKKHSLQMWEVQQEKRALELEHSLTTHVQHVDTVWKAWEANDTLLVSSISEQHNTTLAQIQLEKELARLPFTDEISLKEPD